MYEAISHSYGIDPYGNKVIIWGVLPRVNEIRILEEYKSRTRITKWLRSKLGFIDKFLIKRAVKKELKKGGYFQIKTLDD